MTKIKNNPIMKGASGMLAGTVVYRQYRGKTVMSNRPKKRAIMTPHQQSIKSRFLQAVQYAKKVIADPELKSKYQPGPSSEFTSAYIAALADYLRRLKAGDTPSADTGNQSDTREETAASFGNKVIQNETIVSAHSHTVVNQVHDPPPLRNDIITCWNVLSRRWWHFLARVLPPSGFKKIYTTTVSL